MKINKRKKILIVDDDLSIRELLSELMHKCNYQAVTAENGMEAINLYRLTHPDLVITDIKMPKMDGISLLKQLKSIDNNVLIILISSFGNEEILLEALRAGAVNFLRKPFKIEEMIANAIEHGNLAIGFVKKSEALKQGNFGSLIKQKLINSKNSQKKIYISSHLAGKSFTITIKDQGDGFDWKSLHHYNGRGIILTKIFFDEVIYNNPGNQVTLKKYT